MNITPRCINCPAHAGGVFSCLSAAKLDKLMWEARTREHAIGETIFYEGNPGLSVYCVSAGHIKLTRAGPHGDPHVVATRGIGDLLGCRAVLAQGPYRVSAEPIRQSRVCAIPRASFLEVVREDAALAFAVLTRMAKIATESEDNLMARSLENVRQRTACYLLGLVSAANSQDDVTICGLLPRHEMAQLIGTTPETLSRTLHLLTVRGILEVATDRIVVRDLDALRRVAH